MGEVNDFPRSAPAAQQSYIQLQLLPVRDTPLLHGSLLGPLGAMGEALLPCLEVKTRELMAQGRIAEGLAVLLRGGTF